MSMVYWYCYLKILNCCYGTYWIIHFLPSIANFCLFRLHLLCYMLLYIRIYMYSSQWLFAFVILLLMLAVVQLVTSALCVNYTATTLIFYINLRFLFNVPCFPIKIIKTSHLMSTYYQKCNINDYHYRSINLQLCFPILTNNPVLTY